MLETASAFAMMYHSYNDPMIIRANQVEHMRLEDFPPLSDKVFIRNLVKRSYSVRAVFLLSCSLE